MSGPNGTDRVDTGWLDAHPLPAALADGDKEDRGHVLIVAGGRDMPGAAILAATSSLRAGAGKLTVITEQGLAVHLGTAMPEARVIDAGEGYRQFEEALAPLCSALSPPSVVLVGPGMSDAACARIVEQVLARLPHVPVVLDAAAIPNIDVLALQKLEGRESPVLLTPHAGELAGACNRHKKDVTADPHAAAEHFARRTGSHVLLKGPTTVLANGCGMVWQFESEQPGLGTSGSGDVLAGLIAGLVARGADVSTSAAWGVAIHARCAERLTAVHDTLGFLGRDLVDEIPRSARDLREGRR